MAISKDQKQAQVTDLTQKMSDAKSVIFAHYIGMSVADSGDLRGQLKEANSEMKVAKKTLIKIAAKDAGLPEIADSSIEGPVSLLLSYEDPLSGAQVAFKFSKTHEQVQIIGGIFDGKILTKEEALELAKMPSRDELLAKFVGMICSPLTSFAGMCSSPLSGFARALDQLAEKGGLNPEEMENGPSSSSVLKIENESQETNEAEPAVESTPAEAAEAEDADSPKESDESSPAETAEDADSKDKSSEETTESNEPNEPNSPNEPKASDEVAAAESTEAAEESSEESTKDPSS